MKLVIRTLIFHLLCVIVFTIVYFNLSKEFNNQDSGEARTLMDFILFATTIQAGVGVSHLFPITTIGKIIVTLQQIIMICVNVIILYIFTL